MAQAPDEGFDELRGGPRPVIKVIFPAGDIPLGSTVTKRTGTAGYILGDRVRVFNAGGEKKEIVAAEGIRFLIGPRGDANAIPETTELIWEVEEDSLLYFLECRRDGEEISQ